PRSPRSDGSRRPSSGPAIPAHRPVSAWQRFPQACSASSAYRSSLMPNDILQVGPLQRGRINGEEEEPGIIPEPDEAMSLVGPKPTCNSCRQMSAYRGKADSGADIAECL